jgi:hypothetical protein
MTVEILNNLVLEVKIAVNSCSRLELRTASSELGIAIVRVTDGTSIPLLVGLSSPAIRNDFTCL